MPLDRYLVISEHTAEECRQAVKYFAEFHAGFITHFEWGCMDNDHHAYAFIEANSHEEAMLVVPPLFRHKARVIKVVQFYPRKNKDIDDIHKKGRES